MPQIFFEVKNVIFFGDFGQKTRTAGLIMLKLSTKMNQVFWEKNLENENFITAAIHRENWYFKKTNIFHYFPSKNLKYSQIFLSETIHAQENGSRGPHFAKSLNSNFLKGLTYSALSSVLQWGSPTCLHPESRQLENPPTVLGRLPEPWLFKQPICQKYNCTETTAISRY